MRLNENSFARYENLILLSLENTAYLDQSDPINYYTFRPLKRLEMIILNEIYTPFNFTFYWPPNIRLISVNHNNFASDMDFSALKKLRDVHAISRTIRSFPKFHGQSPLTFLDFRGNPMDSLTAEDLAPFCTLDVLSLEWPGHAVINGTERYCQCSRLQNWIVITRISTNADLNCTPPKDSELASYFNFSSSTKEFRNQMNMFCRISRGCRTLQFGVPREYLANKERLHQQAQ